MNNTLSDQSFLLITSLGIILGVMKPRYKGLTFQLPSLPNCTKFGMNLTSLQTKILSVVGIKESKYSVQEDFLFAKSAFIFSIIGLIFALPYAIFYLIFEAYFAASSLAVLSAVFLATTPMHSRGLSRRFAKINLFCTSFALGGVVINTGGIDSSAACWLLGVAPAVSALYFRRSLEILQLSIVTIVLYAIVFYFEVNGYQVYRLSFPDGSLLQRVYTFIHFVAFATFLSGALVIFAFMQRKLLLTVERQSRDSKAILSNIRLGIFTLNDLDLVVGDDHSEYLERILDDQNIVGQNISSLLFSESSLSEEKKSMMLSILESCIGESSLNFEINEPNFVKEMSIHTKSGYRKFLLVDWQAVVNERTDLIEKMIVTILDVTEMKDMEEKNQKQKLDIELIGEIASISPEKFDRFVSSTQSLISENHRLTQLNFSLENLRKLFINMHTVKGVSRTYRFMSLTCKIHELETYYSRVQKSEVEWNEREAIDLLKMVQTSFEEYLRINTNMLRRGGSSTTVKVEAATIQENIRLLKGIEGISVDKQLVPFVEHVRKTFFDLYYTDSIKLFEDICSSLPSLANDLDKVSPTVTISSTGVGMNSHSCEILRSAFVHILRNSMDHGIEAADLRQSLGKEAQGQISIHVSRDSLGNAHIQFRDDGSGLNLPKIRESALSRNLLTGNSEDSSALAEVIFHPGFSTATSTTDISGRGVGMGAVREFVEKIGGSFEIVLLKSVTCSESVPFTIEIRMPPEHFSFYQDLENIA